MSKQQLIPLDTATREWLKANWHYTDKEIESLTPEQRRRFLVMREPKVAELA